MDEEVFNLGIRQFLKQFGVTAQREIEKAVAAAVESGKLAGNEVLNVHATLVVDGVLTGHRVDGRISLARNGNPQG
jgi:hypothetical protein